MQGSFINSKKMTGKTSIWEYFNENDNDNDNKFCESNQKTEIVENVKKKSKNSEKVSTNYDLTWLKSLLHPSMETQFIRIEILSIINHTKDTIICNLKPSEVFQFREFQSFIGYFNTWWWKSTLSKVEFNAQEELMNSFDFLKRISLNENLIDDNNESKFYLLLNNPLVVADASQPTRGLMTCRRFLIINKLFLN